MSNHFMKLSVISLMCASALPVFAAKPVDLNHQNINYLKSITSAPKTFSATQAGTGTTSLEEVSLSTDFNQTVHIRVKQNYAGFPVWGGDAVVHTPQGKNKNLRTLMASSEAAKSTMNGTVYEELQKDLLNTPAYVFNAAQAEKAFTQALVNFEGKVGAKAEIIDKQTQLMVFVDDKNKARWAFYVSAEVEANGKSAIPTVIMDAIDFQVYKSWDNKKTANVAVKGGGFGGNDKMGKLVYDGITGNLAKLDIERNAASKTCYLQNKLATVMQEKSRGTATEIASFTCKNTDNQHDNVYWNESTDSVNGGFSPNNDALYAAMIINNMYQDWYKIPALSKNGKAMVLKMVTHVKAEGDNAQWNDRTQTMYFGDGQKYFYPLTSLGVSAHEISHGFTSQHSNLVYEEESGGMNEAFSDMADQAAKYYATGTNDFMIGSEIVKSTFPMAALRFMEKPSQDNISADTYNDYVAYNEQHKNDVDVEERIMNVHFSSGIFNRAFYLIAKAEGWNTKKAFDVMVQANRNYWVKTSTFKQGACGVFKAAVDYKYDTAAVKNAFDQVGVDSKC